jgi:hypothetical protein
MIVTAIIITFFSLFVIEKANVPRSAVDVAMLSGIAVIILFFFSTLTVKVDKEFIRFSFGVGLIRKKIALKDVTSFKAITNKRCWSWGIHGWPGKGWLYNVSGFSSVEITVKSGMKYYIGTDEPDKLCGAIERANK